MDSTDAGRTPPLPAGARLLHIGPSKTGTTSIQGAMWAARQELRAQGVRYAGYNRHATAATRAAVGRHAPGGDVPMSGRLWGGLVREVRRAREDRVVISSEYLAHASDEAVRHIVADLDPERVHVVVTLRPLARMLSSLWQQQVQGGGTRTYDDWLERVLGRSGPLPDAAVWHRHRHDHLVGRWAAVTGPARVTVVVLDGSDHGFAHRAFEDLLGLRPGTLTAGSGYENRSLTLGEVEAIRAFNEAVRRDGLDAGASVRFVHSATRSMKLRAPDPSEPRIETPAWAIERALEVAASIRAGIAASGVAVIGDLDRLLDAPGPVAVSAPGAGPDAPALAPAAAAAMAAGIARASGLGPRGTAPASTAGQPEVLSEFRELDYLGYRALARAVVRRVRFDTARATRALLGLQS